MYRTVLVDAWAMASAMGQVEMCPSVSVRLAGTAMTAARCVYTALPPQRTTRACANPATQARAVKRSVLGKACAKKVPAFVTRLSKVLRGSAQCARTEAAQEPMGLAVVMGHVTGPSRSVPATQGGKGMGVASLYVQDPRMSVQAKVCVKKEGCVPASHSMQAEPVR